MAQRCSNIWNSLPETVRDTMMRYKDGRDSFVKALWVYENSAAYMEDKVAVRDNTIAQKNADIAKLQTLVEELGNLIKELREQQ
mgnify:FL=1